MSKKRRKGGGEEHENAERWLLTYADMITLLMAFFIMMYAMSVLNIAKFNEVAFSIRSGFGGVLRGSGAHLFTSPPGQRKMKDTGNQSDDDPVATAEREMKSYIIESNLEKSVQVGRDARGLVISVASEPLLFQRGSAELTDRAVTLLKQVAKVLGKVHSDTIVEGHTCPLPIATNEFPSNWELSAARACRVVRLFADEGMAKSRLGAVGYADTHPRVPNDTEEHRALNRRVEIVVMDSPGSARSGKLAAPPAAGGTMAVGGDRARPRIPKVWSSSEGSAQ